MILSHFDINVKMCYNSVCIYRITTRKTEIGDGASHDHRLSQRALPDDQPPDATLAPFATPRSPVGAPDRPAAPRSPAGGKRAAWSRSVVAEHCRDAVYAQYPVRPHSGA